MVEFTALLTNGTVLDVNNAPSLPIFALRSDHIVHRFPEVRDPIRLYRAYQALLRRDCGAATLTQPDVSDPVSYLKVATEREYRRQVATGYYRFDERTGQYTTTLKGAYQMAWKLMFPMKLIRTALLRERSRATLREIGMAGADQRPVALRER